MQVITLLNEKGGVGKTTLTNTIGTGLAILGHRVLLVDADPQGNLTSGLGAEPGPAFYDLLVRDASFNDVVRYVSPELYESPQMPVRGHLYLIPGNKETRTIAQNIDDALALKNKLDEVEDTIDVVIFDTSPTPSLLHSAIYLATDHILLPTELEYYSFQGLVHSLQYRQGYDTRRLQFVGRHINLMGIIPTKYRGKTLEHEENLQRLQSQFGDKVWPPLPLRIVWGEAPLRKRSIFNYAPTSIAAREAWNLVKKVHGVLTHEQE
jgi:chromosome partitioning protein